RALRPSPPPAPPPPDALRAIPPPLPRPPGGLPRALPPGRPARNESCGYPGRELQGRSLARAAGDQLPVLRRSDNGRQPRHLQERDQGDGPPAGVLGDLYGQAGPSLDR